MKVEWLNDDMTEALLVRGWWKWRRVATVERFDPERSYQNRWRHKASKRLTESREHYELETARDAELARRAADMDWQPVRQLPPARLVKS